MPKRKRTRSGGQRQRLKQQAEEEMNCQSALCMWLLHMFAWGHFSVQRVQKISKLVLTDLENSKENELIWSDLEKLSQLGCDGLYRNKMHAEIMRECGKVSLLPEPYPVEMEYKAPLGTQMQEVFLPHEIFSSIYHNYTDTWAKTIVPSEDHVQKFWEAVDGHPTMNNSPLRADFPAWQTRTVPLLCHGDGVPITGIGKGWAKQPTVFSSSSMLNGASTKEAMMYIWGCFDKLSTVTDSGGTFATFFAVLTWSLRCLCFGRWPENDHKGNPFPASSWRGKMAGKLLAGGYNAFLFCVIGDLDYYSATLKLPHFGLASGPCALCKCTLRGLQTWSDFRKTAAWLTSMWTKEDWFAWNERSKNPRSTNCQVNHAGPWPWT